MHLGLHLIFNQCQTSANSATGIEIEANEKHQHSFEIWLLNMYTYFLHVCHSENTSHIPENVRLTRTEERRLVKYLRALYSNTKHWKQVHEVRYNLLSSMNSQTEVSLNHSYNPISSSPVSLEKLPKADLNSLIQWFQNVWNETEYLFQLKGVYELQNYQPVMRSIFLIRLKRSRMTRCRPLIMIFIN